MKRILIISFALFAFAGCATNAVKNGDSVADNNESFRDPAADTEVVLLKWSGQRETPLIDNCGGTATLKKNASGFFLAIENTQCSVLKTPFGEWKIPGQNRDRNVTVPLEKAGWHKVSVESKKGNGSTLWIEIPPQLVVLDLRGDGSDLSFNMDECGSAASTLAKINRDGSVSVIFKGIDLAKCNRFDLLSNDGSPIDYKSKALPGPSSSFTIPIKFVDWGGNGVMINVYREHFGNQRVLVKFKAKPAWWPL